MLDWLLASVDPARAHEVGLAVSWHGRLMVLAWGVIAPLAVLIARFFKVLPGQDWPRELDNQVWWKSHWKGQVLAIVLMGAGLWLVVQNGVGQGGLHGWLGYGVVVLSLGQVTLGYMRGTKGGPSDPRADGSIAGDHYDMTPWRLMFETVHKVTGYFVLALAALTIVKGLWLANAPNWMWLGLGLWWLALCLSFVILQRRGWAMDTYQAIWGPDPQHPGNSRPSQGWGMRRPARDTTTGESDVRRDRGDRVRGH